MHSSDCFPYVNPPPPHQAGPSRQVAGFPCLWFVVQARRPPLAKLLPHHITSKTGKQHCLVFFPPPLPHILFPFIILLLMFDFFYASFLCIYSMSDFSEVQNKTLFIPGIVLGVLIEVLSCRFIPNRSTTDTERSHHLLVTSMEASGGDKSREEDEVSLQQVIHIHMFQYKSLIFHFLQMQ